MSFMDTVTDVKHCVHTNPDRKVLNVINKHVYELLNVVNKQVYELHNFMFTIIDSKMFCRMYNINVE